MSVSRGWSQNAIYTTHAWLREVLKSRCITRDLRWGVPVPHEKYKEKVFYVWFDAPIGYVSITSCYTTEWEKWWKNPDNVELYHSWARTMCLFTLESWMLMKTINVTEYLNYEAASGYGSIIPDAEGAESHSLTKALGEKDGSCVQKYIEAMEKVKLKQGLKDAMSISSEGNRYLQESQFWKLYKEDKPSCSIVMRTACGLVYLLACLLEPFMPSFSREVLKQLNLPPETQLSLSDEGGEVENSKRPWDILPAGHKIGTPAPLFKELKDEEVAFYRENFAGSQADRANRALKALRPNRWLNN
ncbi:hypothetical protein RND71_008189 [Anisodus tanguticus]|uniref:Methionine--tRNA ligase n=1 Tax=Anisodus tanguticus TaxID=243964 RepID=A0AAE1VU35_9SOLA|nr:hypothetical protein RND71_008189 [Anisodus tanguticus]